jgi:hypothetical protein
VGQLHWRRGRTCAGRRDAVGRLAGTKGAGLGGNFMGVEGACALADALRADGMTALTALCLADN